MSQTMEQPRMFGTLNDEERKDVLTKFYDRMKDTLQKIVKPDGSKESPAKTCADLFAAFPEKLTGIF